MHPIHTMAAKLEAVAQILMPVVPKTINAHFQRREALAMAVRIVSALHLPTCETCGGVGGVLGDSMVLYGIPGGSDWMMCSDCRGTGDSQVVDK